MSRATKTGLPSGDDVGLEDTFILPSGRGTLEINAVYLGHASSRRPQHSDHDDRYAKPSQRCGACRWFEPRIFRELKGQERYLIHYTGMSVVPGETPRTRHEWAYTGYEVVEALTTRRDGTVMLTSPAARVLSQAAAYDDELHEAYVNRAVS